MTEGGLGNRREYIFSISLFYCVGFPDIGFPIVGKSNNGDPGKEKQKLGSSMNYPTNLWYHSSPAISIRNSSNFSLHFSNSLPLVSPQNPCYYLVTTKERKKPKKINRSGTKRRLINIRSPNKEQNKPSTESDRFNRGLVLMNFRTSHFTEPPSIFRNDWFIVSFVPLLWLNNSMDSGAIQGADCLKNGVKS